jgi:hypothetical protein
VEVSISLITPLERQLTKSTTTPITPPPVEEEGLEVEVIDPGPFTPPDDIDIDIDLTFEEEILSSVGLIVTVEPQLVDEDVL